MSQELKEAILANDAEQVRTALTTVGNINRKLPKADKPLFFACEKGADQAVRVLLKAGAKPGTSRDVAEDTAFGRAAMHEQLEAMTAVLDTRTPANSTIEEVAEDAAMEGRPKVLEFMLKSGLATATPALLRLGLETDRRDEITRILVSHGVDVNGWDDDEPVLHMFAYSADVPGLKTLLQHGADVNLRGPNGETPLMTMASQLSYLIDNRSLDECREAIQFLLDAGADAAAVDKEGNDALGYYETEAHDMSAKPMPGLVELLKGAGGSGLGPTNALFDALEKEDRAAVRKAVTNGADVNCVLPPPNEFSPLMMAEGSVKMTRLLLDLGADPNRAAGTSLPLVHAAGCGELETVKLLLKRGADLHAIEPDEREGIPGENAYSAAKANRQNEVVDFLSSLGAGLPKPKKIKRFKPGVASWNDFSELIVKATPSEVGKALAKIIRGQVIENALGQTLEPGKKTYVVVQPKGLPWSHVIRIRPLPSRRDTVDEKLAKKLCQTAKAATCVVSFSDTSYTASVGELDPDGSDFWDEFEGDEDLVAFAKKRKFVAGAFGIWCGPKEPLRVEFPGCTLEQFEDASVVSRS